MKTVLLVVLALFFQASHGAERQRLPNEIIPVSAKQSRTYNDDVANYGPMRGIDGDQVTGALILKSTDSVAWYKVKFDGLYCIDEIKLFFGSSGSTVLTWNCNESGCGKCTGHSACNSGWYNYQVTVTAESSSTDNLPPSLDCLYGDSFELQSNQNFWIDEIAFTGRKVQTVDACLEEKEQLEKAQNDSNVLKNEVKDLQGQLLEAQNKTEGLESRLREEAGKAVELKKNNAELKSELDKARADAKKSACPGQGIWSVPENLIGKKISRRMIRLWKKRGLEDNLKYLGSYKGVKITKELARYIECFQVGQDKK